MNILKIAIWLFALVALFNGVTALSCNAGRAGCIASCMFQKCSTGYCSEGERGVCICSRCGNGSW